MEKNKIGCTKTNTYCSDIGVKQAAQNQDIFFALFSIRKLTYIWIVFNIITRKTLLEYCGKYPGAATALLNWYYDLVKTDFKNFNELKKKYASVSLVGDDRIVFNIMGNKYRLIVRMVFEYKAIQIKWFGTHAEYDKIDAMNVSYKKK